jgi:hypothetical protein
MMFLQRYDTILVLGLGSVKRHSRLGARASLEQLALNDTV